MYQTSKVLFLYCESPLHAGAGEGGVIDLPIQREGHTNLPKIESSSLKGALRETMRKIVREPDLFAVFGPENTNDASRGALAFTDARLLLFPVRSAKGIFAWITCHWAIHKLLKDITLCPGATAPSISGLETLAEDEVQVAAANCPLIHNGELMLEEYIFKANKKDALIDGQAIGEWMANNALPAGTNQYWKDALKSSLVIVPDEAFRDFAALHTEVVTRNKIDPDTGTVEGTALFTEEYLPTDSLLYAVLTASPEFKKGGMGADGMMKIFTDNIPDIVQIGGNATIGKGLVRISKVEFLNQNTDGNGA
ncbi:MAG TPA: type III-B CRISPR module RAMP protein Cmr4 [Bacteroidetes bacterium]|nr:type III-B CRISPR module RAMP protein Cmr4 [Bacteroidota bacterium]